MFIEKTKYLDTILENKRNFKRTHNTNFMIYYKVIEIKKA